MMKEKQKILLISNNQEFAESFVRDLNQEGFQVDLVTDYENVIAHLYHSTRYEMIIMDMQNDDNQILSLCQKLKKDIQLKYLPLICVVQKDLFVEHLVAFELGADEFIYVPYTTPELQLRMRSIQRLMKLQKSLQEKENQLKALRQAQRILVTLSHYINNSLTPLYTMVQMIDEKDPEEARRLKDFARKTVEFINKVLVTLNNLVQSGEMKVVRDGVYKDLLLDIEQELEKLQQNK